MSKKMNSEMNIRKIFDLKLKNNDFDSVILDEINGFKQIFYLNKRKLYMLDLTTKRKIEIDLLKGIEITYICRNFNHDSLLCLTTSGAIYSINLLTKKVIYFSNLDFTKFLFPNLLNKPAFSLLKPPESAKENALIYDIFCNNYSDKLILHLEKYILFWYQSNYQNRDTNSTYQKSNGTIYSIIKENELMKCGITSNNKYYNNLTVTFTNDYFLGNHTRLFYVVLKQNKNNSELFVLDYLFKFEFANKFRCLPNYKFNDYFYNDCFNTEQSEDLLDIKCKITSIQMKNKFIYNMANCNFEKGQSLTRQNGLILKSNIKGDCLIIVINDQSHNYFLSENTTVVMFMTQTYKFFKQNVVDILSNCSKNVRVENFDFICNEMFIIFVCSNGSFFLLNSTLNCVFLHDISNNTVADSMFFTPLFYSTLEASKKAKKDQKFLSVSKQREDLFLISSANYIICYQIIYKTFENKLVTLNLQSFSDFLFLLKYYQLFLVSTQLNLNGEDDLSANVINIINTYVKNLGHQSISSGGKDGEGVIKTDTGIKITKSVAEDEKKEKPVIKIETVNNLIKNIIKYLKIYNNISLIHEQNLSLIDFLVKKSKEFLIHLINHQEIWLCVLFLELSEKYLCSQLILKQEKTKPVNLKAKMPHSNFSFLESDSAFQNFLLRGKNASATYKDNHNFFECVRSIKQSPSNKLIYNRMRILLIFFCLFEFRDNQCLSINVLFFIVAKYLVEKIKQNNMLDDIMNITKIVVKNFKYLKQENDKLGKDEFMLSSISMSYKNEFFSDMKITKTERDDINFDFIAEFYTIDDFVNFIEPCEVFCRIDEVLMVRDFNYMNNTGILQKWTIFLTNYLYYDLFQDIHNYIENHLKQFKDKNEANISPEEKNLDYLIAFNVTFALNNIFLLLKKIITFYTQKQNQNQEFASSKSTKKDKSDLNRSSISNCANNLNSENYKFNFSYFSERVQENFNKESFDSVSVIDIPFIIFSFYIFETNPHNKSQPIDICKELSKRISRVQRQVNITNDDIIQLIDVLVSGGFKYNQQFAFINQLPVEERIQNIVYTSGLFAFMVIHKLSLMYVLESDIEIIYSFIDSLSINMRRQFYELLLLVANGTLKYFLKQEFNQKITSTESKYLELILAFIKVVFYKLLKEENVFVRKNLSEFVRLTPSILTSYLLEGALFYEYKNANQILKSSLNLQELLVNNVSNNNNGISEISIFDVIVNASQSSKENSSSKFCKNIMLKLFKNNKMKCKQCLILLNTLSKLLFLKKVRKDDECLIFSIEDDFKYIKESINKKIVTLKLINNKDNFESAISDMVYVTIDKIIKGHFDDESLFRFNNRDLKIKLVSSIKLSICKILHIFYIIELKLKILNFKVTNALKSKLDYISLISQCLLTEKSQIIIEKTISQLITLLNLLDLKSSSEAKKHKSQILDIIKHIQIAILLHLPSDYAKDDINNLLSIFNFKTKDLLNDVCNLSEILKQITSKNLKSFLVFQSVGIESYHSHLLKIYSRLSAFAREKISDKLLLTTRKLYIQLVDSFNNLTGIPPKYFIDFKVNWQLLEKEQLYRSIINQDFDDSHYKEDKAKCILNQRQSYGKESPKKTRNNSVSKYCDKAKNKRNKVCDSEIIPALIDNDDNEPTKLKIKKTKEISFCKLIDEDLINKFNKLLTKYMFFDFTKKIMKRNSHKSKNNPYKIYSISQQGSQKQVEDEKPCKSPNLFGKLKPMNMSNFIKRDKLISRKDKKDENNLAQTPLENKLYDISEKLKKYENLVNNLGKDLK